MERPSTFKVEEASIAPSAAMTRSGEFALLTNRRMSPVCPGEVEAKRMVPSVEVAKRLTRAFVARACEETVLLPTWSERWRVVGERKFGSRVSRRAHAWPMEEPVPEV